MTSVILNFIFAYDTAKYYDNLMYHCLITGVRHLRGISIANDESWEINNRMWELIHQTGLEHLAKTKKIEIDHALITDFIKRWRPKKNIFHLNSGDATITKDDVAYWPPD